MHSSALHPPPKVQKEEEKKRKRQKEYKGEVGQKQLRTQPYQPDKREQKEENEHKKGQKQEKEEKEEKGGGDHKMEQKEQIQQMIQKQQRIETREEHVKKQLLILKRVLEQKVPTKQAPAVIGMSGERREGRDKMEGGEDEGRGEGRVINEVLIVVGEDNIKTPEGDDTPQPPAKKIRLFGRDITLRT